MSDRRRKSLSLLLRLSVFLLREHKKFFANLLRLVAYVYSDDRLAHIYLAFLFYLHEFVGHLLYFLNQASIVFG